MATLKVYIDELNKSLKDCSFYSPILLNSRTILFAIKERRNHYLVISLNKSNPLIYVIEDQNFYSSFEDTSFYTFKHLVDESIFERIEQVDNDNVLNIVLSKPASKDFKEFIIRFEMIKLHPNLVLENFKYFDESYIKKDEVISREINDELIKKHYEGELLTRKKEKYHNFITYINGKIKATNKKIDAINNDVSKASENLPLKETADNMFTLGLDLKSHYKEIDVYGEKVSLDESLTLLGNIQSFYKKSAKAKKTIELANQNLERANKELTIYKDLKDRFDNETNEKALDKIVAESGLIKKKKETVETVFNKPYKINLNGTIIYFGRNASQNDYLSFVMKLNRDYTWLHIKDKSGSHIVICNVKPTEKELLFAAEVALIASKVVAGEITYTRKKNVRRGHKLGEAIIRNYSTIKLNRVNKETIELFDKATRA